MVLYIDVPGRVPFYSDDWLRTKQGHADRQSAVKPERSQQSVLICRPTLATNLDAPRLSP